MAPTLLILALAFGVLLLARIGGARRAVWLRRWPSVVLGGAALFSVFRGGWSVGLILAGLALVAWRMPFEGFRGGASAPNSSDDKAAEEARALLGVGPRATDDEIRRAYREKISRAHPDRGGGHDQAARLTAARDRLLKKR